ncbi:alpha/beta family hydrolase [Leeia oryzae]|uniref:alpha/beta family hydrolase n=1 Tax=Leeia oryzae TaxID=356662 RepID=UPI000377512F|nr:alpha/beta family hydrolase [Leeia oryzae]
MSSHSPTFPFSTLHFRGANLRYVGSLQAERLLVVVGRNDHTKTSGSIDSLIWRLHALGIGVLWYESKTQTTGKMLGAAFARYVHSRPGQFLNQNRHVKGLMREFIKWGFWLSHPFRWGFMLRKIRGHHAHLPHLRAFIRVACASKQVSFISHSAGGVLCSLLHDMPEVSKLVCFGYPFKHPEQPDEPYRTRHLAFISKPMRIIQGHQDEYGGAHVASTYTLSDQISMRLIETDHDYQHLSADLLDSLFEDIRSFLGL